MECRLYGIKRRGDKMKPEEAAIKEFKERITLIEKYGYVDLAPEFTEAMKMAVSALEKQEQDRWIPVTERLPEDDTEVLVYLFDNQSPYIAWIRDSHWYTEEFEVEKENEPVAWMPLPEPYKAEEKHMTVQQFYNWYKERKLEDAELKISLKFAGLDMKDVPVSEWNIDYGRKEPHKSAQMFVRIGG